MNYGHGSARAQHWVARVFFFKAIFLSLILGTQPSRAEAQHPLDPLSAKEIQEAVSVIANSGKNDQTTRAAMVTLEEPPKKDVLAWKKGEPFTRKAFAVVQMQGQTIEVVIDLQTKTIERWEVIPGAQAPISSSEWKLTQKIIKEDERWQEAMRKRGYTNFDDIFCDALTAGYFGIEEDEGRRLLNMPCYDTSETRTNVYAKPIAGVLITIDLTKKEIVRLIDERIVPHIKGNHEFDEASQESLRPQLNPVRNSAPKGWNFKLDGRMLSWQGWQMHLGFDHRFGPVLSTISHKADGEQRSVLYQAQLSEVFVPYMDPIETWYFRTYMDAGEYGLGILASRLRPNIDCPADAHFMDAVIANHVGQTFTKKQAMCVFERDRAEPLWRHSEGLNGAFEGRPATDLVIRFIPALAHYDYLVDWVFSQNGAIEVRVGATGVDAVRAVPFDNINAEGAEEELQYGQLIAPGLLAVNHDHYFSVRLDFDIDGTANKFVRQRIERVRLPETSRRRSIWQLKDDPLREEGAISMHNHQPQVWRVTNPTSQSALGHARSYEIMGHGPVSQLSPDDWPQKRAAFSAHNLWITTHKQKELYAAGAYPNQSKGGDGLPAYVNGESIEDNDLVAWYTIGFHHVTRPEDWPILPTMWHSVKLHPHGFFSRNPSLDLPTKFVGEE